MEKQWQRDMDYGDRERVIMMIERESDYGNRKIDYGDTNPWYYLPNFQSLLMNLHYTYSRPILSIMIALIPDHWQYLLFSMLILKKSFIYCHYPCQ